ncbi:uncharacterized protein LOC110988598 [Acanthaster planci]|uniref:Uncharacterized protein LOC110988598 n=1 Tax=Acanthaster planci TaxID=133434 RepID=A0A8B7ZSF7_ACAPL|nr:uncharacterized protein LOC110988598 [Acanthaster planci]
MKLFLVVAVVLLVAYTQETKAWEDGDKAPTYKDWKEATKNYLDSNGCSCSSGSCKCCLGFKVVGKKINACATMEYSANSIKMALKFLGSTVTSASFLVTDDKYESCGKKSGIKVCVSLVDVRKTSNSFSAKTKIKVKGVGSKTSGRFTLQW